MYICVCQGITDSQVRETVRRGASCLMDVQCALPVGMCCGRCVPAAQSVIDEQLARGPRAEPAHA